MNEAKSFDGLSGAMRTPSPWLAGEDINGLGDIQVEIEDVLEYHDVTFEGGRSRDKVFALKFKGKQRQLILNATNRKFLVRKFTGNTKQWRGKSITLWFDASVKMGKEQVGGIRIK